MCFRPPTLEGAQIKCPDCGEEMPMSAPRCPHCGAVNAASAIAAPPVSTSVPAASKPNAPASSNAPTAAQSSNVSKIPEGSPVGDSPWAPSKQDAAAQPRTRARLWAEPDPHADEKNASIPVVGGRMRIVSGAELFSDAPNTPTGPGFEKAPDISNTGNYFLDSHYENG